MGTWLPSDMEEKPPLLLLTQSREWVRSHQPNLISLTQARQWLQSHLCDFVSASFALLALFLLLLEFTWIYASFNRPYLPALSIVSIEVRNLDSSAYFATADWNLTLTAQNPNKFGWSYEFDAFLYDGLAGLISGSKVPAFSQAAQSHKSFRVLFQDASVPIIRHWKEGNSEVFEVPLQLHLRGGIEAMPKGSLSRVVQWYISPLSVYCAPTTAMIKSNSRGDVYNDWTRLSCRSLFRKMG